MNEELETFKRAAELGCPDIVICDKADKPELIGLPMLVASSEPSKEVLGCCLPSDSPRINRMAAAICYMFWINLWNKYPEDADHDLSDDCHNMAEKARDFGHKYGN